MDSLQGVMAITPPVVADMIAWIGMIEEALRGGVQSVQLRLKPATPLQMVIQGRRVLELTRQYNVPLIIDDFPDVAMDLGAEGVHLGATDPGVADVRARYGNRLIIGGSAYCDPKRALTLQKQGANYVGFSTPFISGTKKDAPQCQLENVKKALSRLKIPIFLVGGINSDNIEIAKQTGVAGIAVSWGIFGQDDPEMTARHFTRAWLGI